MSIKWRMAIVSALHRLRPVSPRMKAAYDEAALEWGRPKNLKRKLKQMPENKSLSEYQNLQNEAQSQLKSGAMLTAMELYYRLHELNPADINVLEHLVEIDLHLTQNPHALICLHKLMALEPTNNRHYDRAAHIHHQAKEPQKAAQIYQRLLVKKPDHVDAHYNLAFYLSKSGQFYKAIESYHQALALGIEKPEEIHLNLAVIYADHLRNETKAEEHLSEALAINSEYLPALYNLANIHEDRGDRSKTLECFKQILALQPENAKVLSRIIHLQDNASADDPLITRLQQVVTVPELGYSDKVDGLYALGKAFNDVGEYDKAFQYYTQANQIDAQKMPLYDKQAVEAHINAIQQQFSRQWISAHSSDNTASPVFICGMFRSGSTLVEQILASHPDLVAGGERNFFALEMNRAGFSYPGDVDTLKTDDISEMANRYMAQTSQLFPDAVRVTDKRPDNFLYLGLIKTLFPNARIIYTKRNLLDNCLSVYFVRLAKAMNYSVNLEHIAHYYLQQERLMNYWNSAFGDDIYTVDYDQLIASPTKGITGLLQFLNLDWHQQCLNFHQLSNTVKTASVWQVRKPLFQQSSGRWKNFEQHIAPLKKLINE